MQFIIPPADRDEYRLLPKHVQTEISIWLSALAKLHSLGGAKHAKACAALLNKEILPGAASRKSRGFSEGSVRRKWYAFEKLGWHALVNHAKLKKDECLPLAFREWWMDHVSSFKANNKTKRTQVMKAAFKAFIQHFQQGEEIDGLGTWQDWWKQHNKKRGLPAFCPWSVACQPPSLSYRNLARIKPGNTAAKLSNFGVSAARQTLRGVMVAREGYRILEEVVFDDFRTDFKILDWVSGQVCELWGLAMMDTATRKILCFVLVPRVVREDGTKTGIAARDVTTLLCRFLSTYGVPREWIMTMVCENASAAIPEAQEAALKMISGGMIQVRRTSITKGRASGAGFQDESRGNPRGKIIETLWNLTWKDISNTPGYTGADYSLKPAETGRRIAHVTKLLSTGKALGMTREELEVFTSEIIPTMEEATALLTAVWDAHGNRESHSLTGFDSVQVWRWKGTAEWKYLEAEPLPSLPAAAFAEHVEVLQRVETPNERARKLLARDGAAFEKIGTEALWVLHAEKRIIRYDGELSFKVERMVQGRKVSTFYNTAAFSDRLKPGQRYLLTYDSSDLSAVNVITEDGKSYIGTAPEFKKLDPRIQGSAEAAMRESESNLQRVMTQVKARTPMADFAARVDQLDAAAETFGSIAGIPTSDRTLPAPEGVADARRAAAKTKRGRIDFKAAAEAQLLKK